MSEQQLQPGELIVVTEHCNSFVTLLPYEVTEVLPSSLQWFAWRGNLTLETSSPVIHKSDRAMTPPRDPMTPFVNPGPVVRATRPWLSDPHPDIAFKLTSETPSFQLSPLLSAKAFEALAIALSAAPWTRRVGDIYTQDSLNLLAWSQTSNCPGIVKKIVGQLQDPALIEKVAKVTGIPVTARRELTCYRLRPGDRILNHADTTCGGQLRVRINWLLQVPDPEKRPWDFRFWNPDFSENPPVVYSAQPNCAVFFLMGKETPHDIPVVPDNTRERINVVMTFGKLKPVFR